MEGVVGQQSPVSSSLSVDLEGGEQVSIFGLEAVLHAEDCSSGKVHCGKLRSL